MLALGRLWSSKLPLDVVMPPPPTQLSVTTASALPLLTPTRPFPKIFSHCLIPMPIPNLHWIFLNWHYVFTFSGPFSPWMGITGIYWNYDLKAKRQIGNVNKTVSKNRAKELWNDIGRKGRSWGGDGCNKLQIINLTVWLGASTAPAGSTGMLQVWLKEGKNQFIIFQACPEWWCRNEIGKSQFGKLQPNHSRIHGTMSIQFLMLQQPRAPLPSRAGEREKLCWCSSNSSKALPQEWRPESCSSGNSALHGVPRPTAPCCGESLLPFQLGK